MNHFTAAQQTNEIIGIYSKILKKNEVCVITEWIKIFNSLSKKIVEMKAVYSKQSLTLLLCYSCSVSSQQKALWKVSISKFFVEILEKH